MSLPAPLLLALICIAIAAGIVAFCFQRDMAATLRSLSSNGVKTAITSVGPVEYAEKGPHDGAALLSIHGAGGGWDQGLANIAGLVSNAYRVIAPSRFGYLGTPVPTDTSPARQADAHAALLGTLGIERAVVVGVSAGARSAFELALRHPDRARALVLVSPGTYAPDSPVRVDPSATSQAVLRVVNAGGDFAWWAMLKIAPSLLVRFLGVLPSVVRQADVAEKARVASVARGIEPLSKRFAGILIDSNPNLGPLPLEKIAAPTLLISARDDLFNTLPAAQYAAAKIPNARLHVYDSGGHLLVGRSDQTRALIAEFLRASECDRQGAAQVPRNR